MTSKTDRRAITNTGHTGISVERAVHLKGGMDQPATVAGIGYVSKDRSILMESVVAQGRSIVRRSEDAGETWREVEEWKAPETKGDGSVLHTLLPGFFCDPDNGRVLRIFHTCKEQPGVVGYNYARALQWRTYRCFWQASEDDGVTWSEPQQLIVVGPEYDDVHWTDGVWYGKNRSHVMGSQLIWRRCD